MGKNPALQRDLCEAIESLVSVAATCQKRRPFLAALCRHMAGALVEVEATCQRQRIDRFEMQMPAGARFEFVEEPVHEDMPREGEPPVSLVVYEK